MIITLQWLKNRGACKWQLRLFKRRYGESVKVTKVECLAVANMFDFDWLASHSLSPKAWCIYNRACYRCSNHLAKKLNGKDYLKSLNLYRKGIALAFWKAGKRQKKARIYDPEV